VAHEALDVLLEALVHCLIGSRIGVTVGAALLDEHTARAVWFLSCIGLVLTLVEVVELRGGDRVSVRDAPYLFTTPHIECCGTLPFGIERGELAEQLCTLFCRSHRVDGGSLLFALDPGFPAAGLVGVALVVAKTAYGARVEMPHGAVLPAVMVRLLAVSTDHFYALTLRIGRVSRPCHARWRFKRRGPLSSFGGENCLNRCMTTQDGLGGDEIVDHWSQVGFPVLRCRRIPAGVEDVELLGEYDEGFRVLVLELINDTLIDEVVEVVFGGVDLPDGLQDIILPLQSIALILDAVESLHCLDFAGCDVLLVHTPEVEHGVVEEAVDLGNVRKPGALAANVGVVEGDVEELVELDHLGGEIGCICDETTRRVTTDGGTHDGRSVARLEGYGAITSRRTLSVGCGGCDERRTLNYHWRWRRFGLWSEALGEVDVGDSL